MADVKVPDVVSDRERASVVLGRLEALQREAFSHEVERIAQGKAPNDEWRVASGAEKPVTYAERLSQIDGAQQALLSEYSSLQGEIEKILAERKAAAEAAERAQREAEREAAAAERSG